MTQSLRGGALEEVSKLFWKTKAPPKVLIFSWRLLLKKLLTMEQLYRRGVEDINLQNSCVFCRDEQKDQQHLFLRYPMIFEIWQ